MSRLGKAADRLLQQIAYGKRQRAEPAIVSTLLEAGLLAQAVDGPLSLTEAGEARLARARGGENPHLAQHTSLEVQSREMPEGGRAPVLVDADESPLAWLARRKGKDGKPLISASAFEAGERFRAHLTLARTMPGVTSNWSDPVSRGGGFSRGPEDLTAAVLSAQRKVRDALDAVGPELAGILLDVCGFLKGLELVERERAWPPRTAKVVLGLALDRLAAHYGLSAEARGRSGAGKLRAWRAEG